ncbi:branched-chain amino acid ABC transporter permease [Streptococcus chenjunshii]|uniref:Branched-chain amino acid ABC transporter permease n=1 Tax=Streptococcus chenjunshii TaxID=2173853 RepID=A0A372KNR5_9STRE|nr:AzlC family ABC transporter permease [Streptococcus chenjunshii]AXQ77918.1 branched-chain amino acid ABC transporter permease [Streptococcus chenjunshii]RFU51839.1 branched-chain amino acid ABC transporter permease [Streptococcus chenjunshii]RFU53927.1 branched-chain amino acid ABC transporter permease [Streptococcus chenjunshii]
MRQNDFYDGVRASFPTALGYVSIGLACGVVGASSGLSPLEMGLMSIIVYGGSAQFVMCAMLLAQASVLSIVLTVFLVNLRHFLMSLHATLIFKDSSLLQNIAIGSLITDESYGVLLGAYSHHKHITVPWMYGNNLTGYLTWVLAVFFSSILGRYIPNPDVFGLDFALIAMFVAIFAAQLEAILMSEKLKKILCILLTVTVAYLTFSLFISESLSVLLATLSGCMVGVFLDES